MLSYLLTLGPLAEDIGIKQRGGELRVFHAESAKWGTLAKYIKENISGETRVICAGEVHFRTGPVNESGPANHEYKTVNHTAPIYVEGDITTNGIEPAFSPHKRRVIGTWHEISAKHLRRSWTK